MSNDAPDASRTAGVDVKHPLRIVALNASIGREGDLQRLPGKSRFPHQSTHSS